MMSSTSAENGLTWTTLPTRMGACSDPVTTG